VGRVARSLARPARAAAAGVTDPLPLVATRRGRVLVVDAADRRADRGLAVALDAVAPGAWTAVTGGPALRLGDVAAVASDVLAALAVAVRLARPGTVQPVEALALERALLADEARLRAALAAELGPLGAAPRTGGELVETLDAFLAARMSVTGAARLLHVAPRTLAYRLERIEAIRGRPLDAAAWQRYAVLLLARRLLAAPGEPSGTAGDPGRTALG
jgi:DNA-binding PucR family transcriptional regulator